MIFIVFRFLGSSVPQVSFAIISNPPPFVNPIFSSFFLFFSLSSTLPGVAFGRYSFFHFLAPYLSCKCWGRVLIWAQYVEILVNFLLYYPCKFKRYVILTKNKYLIFITLLFIFRNSFDFIFSFCAPFSFCSELWNLYLSPPSLKRHLPLLQGEAYIVCANLIFFV